MTATTMMWIAYLLVFASLLGYLTAQVENDPDMTKLDKAFSGPSTFFGALLWPILLPLAPFFLLGVWIAERRKS